MTTSLSAVREQSTAIADRYALRVLGDPALRFVCQSVTADNLPQLDSLAGSLRMICDKHHGRGLSANQIGGQLRVFIAKIAGEKGMRLFVNPVLFGEKGPLTTFSGEGCLSIPGFYTSTKRHAFVTLRWQDANLGSMQARTFSDDDAQVIQHELNHLDGILLIDGVSRQQRRQAERIVATNAERAR